MARRIIYRRIGQFIAILLKDHIIPGNERHRIAGLYSAGSSAGCARPAAAVGNIKMNIVQLVLYCRQLAIIDGIGSFRARFQIRNLSTTHRNAGRSYIHSGSCMQKIGIHSSCVHICSRYGSRMQSSYIYVIGQSYPDVFPTGCSSNVAVGPYYIQFPAFQVDTARPDRTRRI